jgi:hypothetical protein
MRLRVAALLSCGLWLASLPAHAQGVSSEAVAVDRAVARFYAQDTGGVKSPRFVYERVLSFEARLEAMADPSRESGARAYRSRHVISALERHVAETLLASLHIDPEPTTADLTRQMQSARARVVERVGGEQAFLGAMAAERIGERDVYGILRRQALASLYLDRMVTPMLEPTEGELRAAYSRKDTPFRELPYVQARPLLQRWYTARKLGAAVQAYYQNARGRLNLVLLGELPGSD